MGKHEQRRGAAPSTARAAPDGSRESWYRAKIPALRFVLISAAFMLFFYGVFYTSPEDSPRLDAFIRGYLGAYASAAGGVLDLFGFDTTVEGSRILIGDKHVDVVRGCDAMEPIALYVAAVIAVQVGLREKLVGLGAGVPLLMLVNLVRIIALTLVCLRYSQHFETAHMGVGQTVFIVCTLALWFAWVIWASRRKARASAAG